MNTLEKEFTAFLFDQMEKQKAEEKRLIADERKDEANMVRIKNNIYEIFRTLLKKAGEEAGKEGTQEPGYTIRLETYFLEKAEHVPCPTKRQRRMKMWKKYYLKK